MNIILAEADEVIGTRLILSDHRAKHIIKVLRAEPGDRIRVGVINGSMGNGTVTALQKRHPRLVEMELVLNEPSRTQPALDLILALPRPIMLRRILSQVTALGVGTIHLINAGRVEKSFWEAGIVEPAEYRGHLLRGLEQAVDTRVPDVRLHHRFNQFIEDFWPTLKSRYRHLLLAHPSGDKKLGEIIADSNGRVALAVGPEGGWLDYEVRKFEEQDFSCCTIGERILKVDTAVVALHSRISGLLEIASLRGKGT